MYQAVTRFNDILYRILKAFIMLLLVVLSSLVFLSVVARFVKISMPWSEELAIYVFSWLTYFGAAVVLRNNGHIGVSAFLNMLKSETLKKTIIVIGQLIILAFACTAAYLASGMVRQFYVNDLRSTNMTGLKMAFVFLQVPVSSIIYAFFMIEKILGTITGKEAVK